MKLLAKLYEKISNTWYRKRLHNDNFTIITDTCIGGVMYHKLGKQFRSPTINLWIYDKDFIRFVSNLRYYMSQELRFVEGIDPTPTAWCGDVMIHFNHAHSKEEAAADWNKRRTRINYDNLFIIMSDRPGTDNDGTDPYLSKEDFLSLNKIKCKGKIVFSVRKYEDIDYIVPLPADANDNGTYVNMYMFDKSKWLKRYRWESALDWVHWLNTGEVKLRKCMV